VLATMLQSIEQELNEVGEWLADPEGGREEES
jgi:hypothetical protein